MKTAGIIAEYNPFHNAHKYQIDKLRKLGITHITAVMSGNFVQRGEAALFSKWARTKMALENGIDLVVELPIAWATSYAQRFALGGVSLLENMGCIDTICFGSEFGDIEILKKIKIILEQKDVVERMKENLDMGLSFATARSEAIRTLYGNRVASVLDGPNNNLALEYLGALETLKSEIEPITIKRIGAGHDEITQNSDFVSASQIRQYILADNPWTNFVPQNVCSIIESEFMQGTGPCPYESLEFSAMCSLRQMTPEDIAKAPDVSEGIEYRIHSAVQKAVSLEDLYRRAKTKRYTHARIRRIILHTFLGITQKDALSLPPYIKVLGMNSNGKEILSKMSETAKLPIVTKSSDIDSLTQRAKDTFSLECTATDVYSLACPVIQPCAREKTQGIIVI